mmetsp:Transcript_7638/g.10481  ORF Transcript_7638/g.10481 Transcript_7638/m.10481 type:complete len:325 (+) Transcript_7638:74-1048(+)
MSTEAKTSKIWEKFVSEYGSSQKGKTFAITGCTSGTGLEFAKYLAGLGGDIIMLNRPSDRAEKALDIVKGVAEQKGGKVTHIDCDLMDFKSVREAAEMLKKEHTEVDVLCNNAGIMAWPDKATKDGCDVQMQTNHLSHFLLTMKIWPSLEGAAKKRGEARIVNHSSMARLGDKLEAKYLGKTGGNLGGEGAKFKRYHHSKLANCVFTYTLNDRLKAVKSKIKVLVAHPGLSASNLQAASIAAGGMKDKMDVPQTAQEGAMGIIRAAVDAEAQSGDFFGPGKSGGEGWKKGYPNKIEPEEVLLHSDSKKMLWKVSNETLGESWDV